MACPDCAGDVEFSTLRDPAGGASVLIWDCSRCQRSGFVPTQGLPVTQPATGR